MVYLERDYQDWAPERAAREAEKDIRSGTLKLYWSGPIARYPIGIPLEQRRIAEEIPIVYTSTSCNARNVAFRARQMDYAQRYNSRMIAYLTKGY